MPGCRSISGNERTRSLKLRSFALSERIGSLVRAVQDNDDTRTEEAILALSHSRGLFAPLAFAVGAVMLLFGGLRLLLSNWRLLLVQILPAVWVWLAMFDLKANFFNGRSFHSVSGPVLVPIGVAMVAITVACFYLNTVFGFAIGRPGTPQVRPGFAQAWHRRTPIIAWGIAIGTPFAMSTLVVARVTGPWFVLILGIVVGVMMICFLAVPARLVGAQPAQSRRDKVATTALGGVLSAIVCTPPYLLGRLGILMLGTSVLFIPGIILLTVGFALEAGATAAVRAIKLSAKLISRDPPASGAR